MNISSPNTPGLRELQEGKRLVALLGTLAERSRELAGVSGLPPKPILVKIAPDLAEEQVEQVVEIVRQTRTAGIIATNTTTARDGLVTPAERVVRVGAGAFPGPR